MDKYEEELLMKIDNKEKLTENELKDLIFEYEYDEIRHEDRRWSRTIETISMIGNRYFRIYWENGLTEYQPNEFYNQPEEVELHEYEKTVTIKEWKTI